MSEGSHLGTQVESTPSAVAAVGGGSPASSGGPTRAARFAELLGSLRLGRFSGVFLLALFIAVFAVWIPGTFLTATTARTIAIESAITMVLALGALITLSSGMFDLSLAQNFGLAAIVCVSLITGGTPPLVAVVLTILIAGVVGLINAILVVRLGIESLIATLGMSSVLLAFTAIVSGNQYVGPAPESFSTFVSWQPLGIPILAIYAIAAAIVMWWVLEHTPVGRRVYAVGANPDTARLSGIPVYRYMAGALIVGGLIAGLAGSLEAAKLGTISPELGAPFLLPTYAAVFLSATQIKPGRFNVWGLVVSLYLLGTGVKGLVLAGGQLWITNMFNGVALIVAVGVAVFFQRRREARAARRATGTAPDAVGS
ncbi:MAG: ABC transporter permease [Actinobacteria bacterium]|nr:ABC transporter permease [Actinomycetota bacterium]